MYRPKKLYKPIYNYNCQCCIFIQELKKRLETIIYVYMANICTYRQDALSLKSDY
jgi:predicted nucleic acid-binding Zn ribbon protein